MKISISIDGDLLREADEVARSMEMSRSRLFARAVGDFLKQHREEQMLRDLNVVYEGKPYPGEKDLLNLAKAKIRPV
jgi:metal-responsive CopG/Arc/MetJ family transcriptional regulator